MKADRIPITMSFFKRTTYITAKFRDIVIRFLSPNAIVLCDTPDTHTHSTRFPVNCFSNNV